MMHSISSILTSLALASGALAKMQYIGVAMPGIDFGCDIDGTCPIGDNVVFPLRQYHGGDSQAQMEYFVNDDDMNVFRLPTTWQWITKNKLGGKLDTKNWGMYEELVDACLETGAYCMIDLHNFARFNGGIIGQGGPTDDDFVDIWQQITHKYGKEDKIMFGLMNEPHDLDIDMWAKTCQKAVTAIRKAGATSQMILLPGTNFTSVESFVSTGSAEALSAISNPDGSKDGLILDVHKYLDINNSGSHAECTTDNVEAFEEFADWLRQNKRKAIISETGASLDETCMTMFCAQNKAISKNDDVYIGFVGWGAGSFDSTYLLTLSPLGPPTHYRDNALMKECIIKPFIGEVVPKKTTSTSTVQPTKTATGSSTSTETDSSSTQTNDPVFKEADKTADSTSKPSASGNAASSKNAQSLTGGLVLGAAALWFLGA
ncbi:glycoside hydrolase superfamily [Mariannaea sp. PMI_226]|nr:glycoside hydrolase superfamily [Mariannaea sp. PMI_226]